MGKYLLVQGSAQDACGNTVNCDGIAAPSGLTVLDVSTDRSRLETFICRLNEGEADEIHLFDLIEDFITEEHML